MELLLLLFVQPDNFVFKDKNKHSDAWKEHHISYQVVSLVVNKQIIKNREYVKEQILCFVLQVVFYIIYNKHKVLN